MLKFLLAAVIPIAGCSGFQRGADWPTLAPRPGEVSPLVPRTPLGSCAGCSEGVVDTPVSAAATSALLPAPADTAARLAAVADAIAAVEAKIPGQRRATDAAIAAASGKPRDSNAASEAEVQRSRLESLFLPLAVQSKALDDIEDNIAGKADTAGLLTRLRALRDRLAKLDADRLL